MLSRQTRASPPQWSAHGPSAQPKLAPMHERLPVQDTSQA
jgi:hypothetical protein